MADVNKLLASIRDVASMETDHLDDQQITEFFNDLASDVEALDRHLSSGGPIPAAWQRATVTGSSATDQGGGEITPYSPGGESC